MDSIYCEMWHSIGLDLLHSITVDILAWVLVGDADLFVIVIFLYHNALYIGDISFIKCCIYSICKLLVCDHRLPLS